MRGFVIGSIALIAVYVAVQPTSAKAAQQGGAWFVSGLRRLLSPDVAGVPQRKTATTKTATKVSGG